MVQKERIYMEKIRELFHAVFNHLNNISVMAGAAREELSDKNLSQEEQEKRAEALKATLSKVEDHVGLAAKTLEELRELIKPKEGDKT